MMILGFPSNHWQVLAMILSSQDHLKFLGVIWNQISPIKLEINLRVLITYRMSIDTPWGLQIWSFYVRSQLMTGSRYWFWLLKVISNAWLWFEFNFWSSSKILPEVSTPRGLQIWPFWVSNQLMTRSMYWFWLLKVISNSWLWF